MSILQVFLLLIVVPGIFRVYSAVRNALLKRPSLAKNATKIAFVFVVVSVALFATPLMTLGLPPAFRFISYGIYLAYVVTGALYVADAFQAISRRGSGPRQ